MKRKWMDGFKLTKKTDWEPDKGQARLRRLEDRKDLSPARRRAFSEMRTK